MDEPGSALRWGRPARSVLEVSGAIEETELPQLRQAVQELVSAVTHAVVDLDQVTFIPAAAVGVIVRARVEARAKGGTLTVVAAADSRAGRILRLCDQRSVPARPAPTDPGPSMGTATAAMPEA